MRIFCVGEHGFIITELLVSCLSAPELWQSGTSLFGGDFNMATPGGESWSKCTIFPKETRNSGKMSPLIGEPAIFFFQARI